MDNKLQELGKDATDEDKEAAMETVANGYDSLFCLALNARTMWLSASLARTQEAGVGKLHTELEVRFARKGHLVAAQGLTEGLQMLFDAYTSNNGGELLTVDDSIPLALFDKGVNTVAAVHAGRISNGSPENAGENKCTIASRWIQCC